MEVCTKHSEELLQNGSEIKIKQKTGRDFNLLPLAEGETLLDTKAENETAIPLNIKKVHEVKLWKKKKISVNKSLICIRIAIFLWFGAGRLPSLFLSIFMSYRGLTLIEYSSAFCFIFLFQSITNTVSGVIADKIGNGKPALLFHIMATALVMIGMLLTPSINTETCKRQETHSNCSDNLETNVNFTFCLSDCFYKNNISYNGEQDGTDNSTTADFLEYSTFIFGEVYANDSKHCNDNIASNLCYEKCESLFGSSSEGECVTTRNNFLVALYIIWIFALYSFITTGYRFMDFIALSIVDTNYTCFGRERIVAASGELCMTLLLTFVLNIEKSSEFDYNFDVVLWFVPAALMCTFILIYSSEISIRPPGRKLSKKAYILMKDVDFLAFLLIVFIAGNGFCFNLNLNILFLKRLKAPRLVIALYAVTFSLYGFPVLLTSKWWLKKLGTQNIFVLGLVSYAVNHAAYSLLYNPWLSLIIECTVAFTYQLFWVAVVLHIQSKTPQDFIATFNAVAGATHYGIGRSSGLPIGGLLVNYLGQRSAYRVTSSFFLLAAILFFIFFRIRRNKCHRKIIQVHEDEDREMGMSTSEKQNNG